MLGLTLIIVAALSVGIVTFLLILLVWRCFCFRQRKDFEPKAPSFRATVGTSARVQQTASVHHQPRYSDVRRRGNQYGFPRGVSVKPLFSWADHPSLVNDAVENGWSQFAFAGNKSPPTRSTLLGNFCAVGDQGIETEAEMMWEVCQGSVEFMQKIRFNPGVRRVSLSQASMAAASVVRAALPLPGPPLGNTSAFPQEAYFEITILHTYGDYKESVGKIKEEGEKTKLIQENSNAKAISDSLIHVTSSQRVNNVEEFKVDIFEESGNGEGVKLSLGLTAGGSLPSKLPGSYPGSIGFNSDGSLYLDGIKLVFESNEADWGRTDKVIGCGFDHRQKKVYFTVDSELVHVVHCKSEEFGTPLYPTLASNTDISVLVNLGQSVFAYGPANAQRTANPCFVHPPNDLNSPAFDVGYEDSRDLFSMKFDSQWLNSSTIRGSQNSTAKLAKGGSEHETEVELFEIVLEDSGRYSNAKL